MAVPSIINVYPANGSEGIAIGDSVKVTFNQEMDTDSINSGTFVVRGPDNNVFFNGELNPFQEPGFTEDDILNSPYYGGYVEGTITFQKVDDSGDIVDDSVLDTEGDRNLWKTDLKFASLRQANLKSTKLEKANLQNAKLIRINLESADLWKANLKGTKFISVIVDRRTFIWGCDFDEQTVFNGKELYLAGIEPRLKTILR